MKVALVVPTRNYPNPMCLTVLDFPTGLAYLAAALKTAGHKVIGLNPNNDFNHPSAPALLCAKLKRVLENDRPQLIGLSGLCVDYLFFKDAIKFIRSIAPRVPIVCGGGIITHDPEFIFNQLKPDFGVIGEGEEVLVQLVRQLETGDHNYETVPNLWYWKNGVAIFSGLQYNYPDINSRSFPDYKPFDMEHVIGKYALAPFYIIRYTRPYPRVMPLVAARSCPFNCTFCVHQRGPKYRARSMESILEEIGLLYNEYHFNILFIADELFAIDRKRLRAFCNGIAEGRRRLGWDFNWVFNTHASAAFRREELQMARDAGCSFFSYGIESASPRVLASMNKKTQPSQIAEAITLANEVGIGFGGNFLFGDVAETPETIMESLNFFIDHCMDFFVSLVCVAPYPGSKLFEYCLERRIIPDKPTFYESIDAEIVNMTAMNDHAWKKWVKEFIWYMYPATALPFLMPASAISCYQEEGKVQCGPGLSKTTFGVHVCCPHCAKKIFCRELLDETEVIQGSASFVTGCPACSKRFNVELRKGHTDIPDQRRRFDVESLRAAARYSMRLFDVASKPDKHPWDLTTLRTHISAHIANIPLRKIACYGAGNDFKLLVSSGVFANHSVVAVVDNYRRKGEILAGIPVISENDLGQIEHDMVVVTSSKWAHEFRAIATRRSIRNHPYIPVI